MYSIHYRIGEAKNPGPPLDDAQVGLTIGTANPTGLLTKSSLLADLPGSVPAIWGISETQLSNPGIVKFQKELLFRQSPYKLYHGAPAPLRSNSIKAIGGKSIGTAFLSSVPSRPLQATWPDAAWSQARFVANTFFFQGEWIHGATFYGPAFQAELQATKDAADDLLGHLTHRIVHTLKGKRFICGDFNQLDGELSQPAYWASLGWKEVQQLSAEKYGTPIQVTCKGKTTKDFLWLSPELCQYFDRCILDPHVFKDHSALCATFRPFGPLDQVPVWRIPKPLPWEDIGPLPNHNFTLPSPSTEDPCVAISQEFERRVTQKLQTKGMNLLPCQMGRSCTVKTKTVPAYNRPLPPGRHGDFVPKYHGVSLQHIRWVRQLRRLESFSRTTDEFKSLSQVTHRQREWRAILTAPGFPRGFVSWWKTQSHVIPGIPSEIPIDPPSQHTSQLLRLGLEGFVQQLESILNLQSLNQARKERIANPRLIFRDIKPARTPMVEVLDLSRTAVVSEICPDELAVALDHHTPFEEDRPILSSQGPLDVIHFSSDKIWVGDLLNLQPGAKLVQEHFVGQLHELFSLFQTEWATRWDKHLHTPETRWDPICSFIQDHVPAGEVMEYHPISLAEWQQCLRRKRVHSATGPDGWSRADLLHMPDDLSMAFLQIIAQVESGQPWPPSLMTGIIHSLQKQPDARCVSHYRPITLCSMVYRCWSSIRARQALQHLLRQTPSQVCGNVPGRSTKDLWYDLQLRIESSNWTSDDLTGCVVDIIKAFNNLPRRPVLVACSQLGLPAQVIRSWGSALCQLDRRFHIRGGTSPAQKSTTGFAEGCPMSVVGMLALNLVAVSWMAHHQPSTAIHSFVDNIELIGPSAASVQNGFGHLCDYFRQLDLEWDPAKTYFWSTNPSSRFELRSDGLTPKSWARDLGAHMQYTKASTNSVITDKIAAFQPKWKALARSPAPASQKKVALVVAAWPNVLHGVSSVHLAAGHFDQLRTQAVRGFADQTPGTSPVAILSLSNHPRLDPEFFALWSTILDFRTQTSLDRVKDTLDLVSQPTSRVRPAPGPCSVLLHRLSNIGWFWDLTLGFCNSHLQPVSLWDDCIQALSVQITEAWQSRQAARLADRKTFAGMSAMNARFTTEAKPRCEVSLGILQKCWDGTFYTANHLRHRAQPVEANCTFCGEPDSAYHRNWVCPALESARIQCPPDVRQQIPDLPLASSCHGWFPTPSLLHSVRAQLCNLPDTTWEFDFPAQVPALLDLFTDGACELPHDSFCRIAAWGVALYAPLQQRFLPLAADVLPGLIQTSTRAEYTAAISAVRFVLLTRKPFRLWIDNQQVHAFLTQLFQGHQPRISASRPNHDLKQMLGDAFTLVRSLCRGIIKVCSHQHLPGLLDVAEEWACQGNSAADSVAGSGYAQRPGLLRDWERMCLSFQEGRRVRDSIHQVLVAVGSLAISRIKGQDQAVPDASPVDSVVPAFHMEQWPFPADIPPQAQPFAIHDWSALFEWVTSLQTEGEVHYLSWYQLFVDFTLRYPNKGPWYHVPSLRWWSHDSMPSVTWTKRCRWFSTFFTKLAKTLNLKLPVQNRRPTGHAVAFWINCMPVCITRERLASVDHWLGQYKAVFYNSKELRLID